MFEELGATTVGVKGKQPIGACVTIGTKSGSGAMIDKDRFYIKKPFANENNLKDNHPAFTPFNECKDSKKTSVLNCTLVHVDLEDAFRYLRKAQILGNGWPAHPGKAPACMGNGVTAERYFGDPKENAGKVVNGCTVNERGYIQIACPGEQCEFAQGDKKPCKLSMWLLFELRWKNNVLPSTLCRFASGSEYHTVPNAKGFFDGVVSLMDKLGVKNRSIFGLPFTMEVTMVKKKAKKFPVVTFSSVGLTEWLLWREEYYNNVGADGTKLIGGPAPSVQSPELNQPQNFAFDANQSSQGIPQSHQPNQSNQSQYIDDAEWERA